MAGNGVRVLLFEALRPTPELSFAGRHYKATAGINITASHNPREYNGYKVYWSDGAQLPPRHADAVAEKMKETDIFTGPVCMDFDQAVTEGMIRYLGAETDEKFLDKVLSQAIDPDTVRLRPTASGWSIPLSTAQATGGAGGAAPPGSHAALSRTGADGGGRSFPR
jgi:phosphoglucomutase